MTTSLKNNFLPPLISNLQQVLIARNNVDSTVQEEEACDSKQVTSSPSLSPSLSSIQSNVFEDHEKEIVLVTNGEGIDSPGLLYLVESLVRDGHFNVHVLAPQSDKSVSGHSVTVRETLAASSVEIGGATAAYEVSGTPADCVSLALSGALFSWSKPVLVISGINRGSSCGHNMFYSGAVAAAREALICGVPSLSISLNWKNGGFKVTRQSLWRTSLRWQAVSANRHPSAAHFMSNQQSLGIKLAQLSRDASAAGAARRLNSHRKTVEIESVGVAGKVNATQTVKKYFCLGFSEKEQKNVEEDEDFRALEDGFVAVTPFSLTYQPGMQDLVSNWVAAATAGQQ